MSNGVLIWLRLVLYSIATFAVAWQTTMNGVVWESMDWVEKSCVFAGLAALWGNTMVAFFDKSLWRYDQERMNGNGGNGQPPASKP